MNAVGPHIDVLLPFQGSLAPLLEFSLPDFLETGDCRGRQALGCWPDQRRQGFAEVARADSFEIQPGNQFLQALRLPQVRRQNLRGKRFRLLRSAPIQHPRLLDFHRADAGHTAFASADGRCGPPGDGRCGPRSVLMRSIHSATSASMASSQQSLSAVAKNVASARPGPYGWQRHDRFATLSHGGVLRGRMWLSTNQIQTQVRRLFQLNSSTTFGYSSTCFT